MKSLFGIILSSLVVGCIPSQAQVIPSITDSSMKIGPAGEIEITATCKLEIRPVAPYVGAPYSARKIFQQTQILPDGTKITRTEPDTLRYFRDSAGRERFEYPFRRPKNFPRSRSLPVQVEILDPVAGYHYIFDEVNHIVHQGVMPLSTFKFSPPFRKQSATATPPSPGGDGRPRVMVEDLGTRVMDGIVVEGSRATTTHPPGSVGNDRPVTTMSEVWTSPDLGIPVVMISTDLSAAETIGRYFEISRKEPDPSLFQIPPGYRVVHETGPFAIRFTLR